MDPALIAVLLVASLLIGATGTWSPCGFSMVETIGPTGHTGGRPTTLAACAAFLPGALAGAVFTFGGLGLLGAALPGGLGWLSYAVAVVVALVAAVAEARGARIAPQIRRQLPEHWRRVMPMPLAAALYGVLLGLGFTTFVLTFGVWALAGISLALGEPAAGLAIGLGFGVGRAIPIVTLAPFADRPLGRRAITLMAERPGLYRAIRLGDAVALVAAAGALTMAASAEAEVKRVDGASDPSRAGRTLAFADGPSDRATLSDGGGSGQIQLPGTDPSIARNYVATLDGDRVVIYERPGLTEVDAFPAQRVDAVSVGDRWIAYRTRARGRDRLFTRPLDGAGHAGNSRRAVKASSPNQIGMPSVDGNRLAFAVAKQRANRIVLMGIKSRNRKTVIASKTYALSNPSIRGKSILYVRGERGHDELRLKSAGNRRPGRALLSRKRLWSTALSARRAYVTVLSGRRPRADITSVRR